MKKFILLLICVIPFSVFAETYSNYSPNRYYGYFETITIADTTNNIMMSYFDNGSVDDDQYSSFQTLLSNNTNSYRLQLSTYMPSADSYCPAGSLACMAYEFNNNYTEVRYFEQDICVSTNKLKFSITNGGSDDFASNSDSLALYTGERCDLYYGSKPDNVVGPAYWEWLENYEGYVVKVFLPIAEWKSGSNNNGNYWEVVSRFHINNYSDYTAYYRFLTSGGLYDHSRYLSINDSFDLDTQNFDLTYDAIMDGMTILDENTNLVYHTSKNLLYYTLSSLKSSNTLGTWNNNVYSFNGVTYTVNDDLSITVGGSYSSRSYFYLHTYRSYDSGKYYLSGTTNGTLVIDIRRNGSYWTGYNDNGTGVFVDLPSGYDYQLDFYININNSNKLGQTFYPQFELGTSKTSYCPYGPTLDNNCVSHFVDNIITWDSNNVFNNIYSILNLPLKLSSSVINGVGGNCQPLQLTLFNKNISLPCGDFFWGRSDVSDFRLIWNLLFGGFIIYRLLIWFVRVLISSFDPLEDSTDLGINLISSNNRRL